MDGYREPIFKGCTRPAMIGGIPMVPLLIVGGGFVLVAYWSAFLLSAYVAMFVALMAAPVLWWMRYVTTKDDQRLRQLMLRFRLRARQSGSRRIWGAVSYSPLKYKRRKS